MADYRLIFFDRADQPTHRLVLRFADDAQAIEAADRHTEVNAVEVWRGDVLIRRLPIRPPPGRG